MAGKRGGAKRPVGGGAEFESFHTSYPAKIDMVTEYTGPELAFWPCQYDSASDRYGADREEAAP